MLPSRIVYRNRSSDEFGMLINWPFELAHAEADVTVISVPGVSGDIIRDNYRYKNITQIIKFLVQRQLNYPDLQTVGRAITNWISGPDYSPLQSDIIHGYQWEARSSAPPQLTQSIKEEADLTLTFDCKPFLKRLDGQNWQPVPNDPINTEQFPAEPLWHIKGSGNLTLTVNGLAYQLNGIDDEVYIDSEQSLVYKSLAESRAGLAVFPNNDFPVLNPGGNSISLAGNYSLLEYKPNWRCLA